MEISLKDSGAVKKPKGNRFLISLTLFILYLFVLLASSVASFIYFGGFDSLKNTNAVLPYTSFKISLGKNFPDDIDAKIREQLGKLEKDGVKRFIFDDSSELELGWKSEGYILNKYIVPIANFYTISDDFNSKTQKIVIDSSMPLGLQKTLKDLYPKSTITSNLEKSLDSEGKTVALIQAKDLTYKYKLLKYNGKYFLDDKKGAITFSLSLNSEDKFLVDVVKKNLDSLKTHEYDFQNIGKLNQTGVTAITRALAKKIEDVGDYGYPAKQVGSFLKDADLTHVSNEISFVPGCIPTDGMRFCSHINYLKTLKDSGVDIVELTGNHNNDYGSIYNTQTISTYEKLGWKYFGGGKDIDDASKILYVDSKGTKLAFIGYDYYDTMQGTGALATKSHAGANTYSEKKLASDIKTAKAKADIVIVDFQFQECYSYPQDFGLYPICYKPLSAPDQKGVFRKASELGADIVVGTQAHQPQTYEIYKGKMIFYGLGNLFFDQARWPGTKHGLILTHYYLNGKYLQTKITTTNYDGNLQTYISKGSERTFLLNLLKQAR